MAIRTDIFSIDWSLSPRIINIALAFDEVDAQDLYDTCKHLEALHSGTDEGQIADAGGWEPLGTGVFVGITVSLFNAKYKFADRPGPDWVICNMTGGNVVGFTDIDKSTTLYPREPSAYVSADRTASSSATTREQEALQFASYNGGITVDMFNVTGKATSSLIFPAGTELQPIDNLDGLSYLLSTVGLTKVYVKGHLDLTDEGSWIGLEFIGESSLKTTIDIEVDADVFNCEFYDCHVRGTLDGSSQIERSVVDSIDFVEGFVFSCALGPNEISLGTNTIANFFSCYSTVPGISTPIIDMNVTGILALRDYNGGMLLKNYSGSDSHSIDLASGQLKLDSTITSGIFVVRGVGKLIDTNGNQIPSGTWNGGVTIVNETSVYLASLIQDILEGDMMPTEANWKILHKLTKQVLVNKNTNKVGDLTQLIEV